jgi:hypothetical protein
MKTKTLPCTTDIEQEEKDAEAPDIKVHNQNLYILPRIFLLSFYIQELTKFYVCSIFKPNAPFAKVVEGLGKLGKRP